MTDLSTLEALLQQPGQNVSTPCYVYSVSSVIENYQRLKKALGTKLVFSFKANSNLDLVVRCGHIFEDGIEIASLGELNSLASGDAPRYINNPSADKNFIRAAIASKATLIIDNLDQLELISEFVDKRPIQPVVLRLNHCVINEFSGKKNIRPNHFGMDWETASKAIERINSLQLELKGFHLFSGSYNFNRWALETAQAALQVTAKMEKVYGKPISYVNLGGGFDNQWRTQSFDFEQYRALLTEFPDHITLAHESGRGIVGSAGYFLTKVRYLKSIDGQKYAVCDGGMAQNFLLAQTERPLKKYQSPIVLNRQTQTVDKSTLLVGTSCNKDDVIGRCDAVLQVGDILAFDQCGAYNASYTVSPFLTLPSAKTYLME